MTMMIMMNTTIMDIRKKMIMMTTDIRHEDDHDDDHDDHRGWSKEDDHDDHTITMTIMTNATKRGWS